MQLFRLIKLIRNNHDLPNKYKNVELDEFTMMPNHLHGIIIVGADLRVCPDNNQGEHTGSPLQKPVSLSRIVQWFKTMTTNEYIKGVRNSNWLSFNKRLWQRNYYEHIIRDENELNRIRKYIIENPLKWDLDRNNPINLETK
jgi:putative transposase